MAQQTGNNISAEIRELRQSHSSVVQSDVGSSWTRFFPANISIAPFPTREYTDDEFQSIVKDVMGVL